MRDYYSPMAEFYELVARRQAAASGPPLAAALSALPAGIGPVVEIGAGTGRLTEVIAAALPTAPIVAAEPSATMRAILTSRVASRPELRGRVTVVDGAAPGLALPPRIGAAVVFGVAGHLPGPDRVTLWRRLRERLAPGGIIVVELMGARALCVLPPTLTVVDTVGRRRYEWWVEGRPGGSPGLMRFTTTWRIYRGDTLTRVVDDSYDWWTQDPAELAAESGLNCADVSGAAEGTFRVVVLTATTNPPVGAPPRATQGLDPPPPDIRPSRRAGLAS